MDRRKIAADGAQIALGILAMTALVALVQIVSCNRADEAGEGSWIMPCWVYEEETVPDGTVSVRVSETRVIQVPQFRIDHHWHPLAVAGWSLPAAIALVAGAIAIRQRSKRALKLGTIAALVVVAAAYFISPLVAWHIGPRPGVPQTPVAGAAPSDDRIAQERFDWSGLQSRSRTGGQFGAHRRRSEGSGGVGRGLAQPALDERSAMTLVFLG